MSCTVTYTPIGETEPIEFEESEFVAFLAAGEYEKILAANTDLDLPPIPPTPKASEPKKPSDERPMRGVTKQFLRENPKLAEFMSEDAIYYNRMPNSLSISEATKIIETTSLDYIEKGIKDFNNGMNGGVRSILAQLLIKEYERQGRVRDAIDLREWLAIKNTEAGQFSQASFKIPTLSPANEAFAVQLAINKLNEQRAAKDKNIGKIFKGLSQANEEIVNETIAELRGKVETLTKKLSRASANYGSKNKLVTKENYEKLVKDLNKMTFAAALPVQLIPIGLYHIEAGSRKFADFSEAVIEAVGEKVRPYLDELYKKSLEEYSKANQEVVAKKYIDKLEKAIAKKAAKEQQQAIANLQNVAKEEGLWGKYRDMAAKRLKNISLEQISKDVAENAALEDFTSGLVRNLQAKINESLPETERKSKPIRSAIEIIGDAYKNTEKYADVWEQTKKEFEEKYKGNEEVLEGLDAYFGDILETPFSQKELGKAVSKGLKELGETVTSIIQQHYTVYQSTKQTLTDKLIDEAGLSGEQARQLAEAVSREFDRIAMAKKQKVLETIFSKKERAKPTVKSLESELIRLTNLGAFNNDELVKAYAEKMGWAKLTDENIKEIERLASLVERTPEGLKKRQAIEDLLGYQAKLKGVNLVDVVFSVWYANMLSGYNTQLVNAASGFMNTMAEMLVALRNPKSAPFLIQGWLSGLKQGLYEAKTTFQTGYSPVRGKVEIPSTLELYPFKGGNFNPANYLKYVRRIMAATDVFIAGGLKEMRAYQWARMMAVNDGKLEPNVNTRQRALEYLRKNSDDVNMAKNKAALELQKDIERINEEPISESEKRKKIEQAKKDEPRRVFEILELSRPSDLVKESSTFAARATYNYPTEGLLGILVNIINKAVETNNTTKIFKLVIPFTTVVGNVANEALNYTPVGYARASRLSAFGKDFLKGEGSIFNKPRKDYEEMSDERKAQFKADLMTKATLGLGLTVAVYLLSTLPMGDDEDDKPMLQITANGTGDYQKNELLKQDEGWQPYSYRVLDKKTGKYGAWISYRYSPLVVMFSAIGNLKDYEAYRKEKLTDTEWTKFGVAMTASMRVFFDATFLSSLNNFMSTMFSGSANTEEAATSFYKGAIKTGKTFVLPALYTQAAKDVEAAFKIPVKQTKTSPLGILVEDIPYLRNYYENKIDALGNEVVPDTDILVSAGEGNKIVKLLAKTKSLIKPPDIRKETFYDMTKGEESVMNDKQFNEYSKTRGSEISKFLNDNYDELSEMPIEDAKKMIKNGIEDATITAKAKIQLPKDEYDAFYKSIQEKRAANIENKALAADKLAQKQKENKITDTELKIISDLKKVRNRELAIKTILVPLIKSARSKEDELIRYEEVGIINQDEKSDLKEYFGLD